MHGSIPPVVTYFYVFFFILLKNNLSFVDYTPAIGVNSHQWPATRHRQPASIAPAILIRILIQILLFKYYYYSNIINNCKYYYYSYSNILIQILFRYTIIIMHYSLHNNDTPIYPVLRSSSSVKVLTC